MSNAAMTTDDWKELTKLIVESMQSSDFCYDNVWAQQIINHGYWGA